MATTSTINSCPHQDTKTHNAEIDSLLPEEYIAFFRGNPRSLSHEFVELMRASPRPPDDPFESAGTIARRAFGQSFDHCAWNTTVGRIAKPLCQSIGLEELPVFRSFCTDASAKAFGNGVWSDVLVNFHRDNKNKRWLLRLRPALVDALIQLNVITKSCFTKAVALDQDDANVAPSIIAISSGTRAFEVEHIARMVDLICGRVTNSDKKTIVVSPTRTAGNRESVKNTIRSKLLAQNNLCYLCGGELQMSSINPMLQPSPDRIDSSCDSYGEKRPQAAAPDTLL